MILALHTKAQAQRVAALFKFYGHAAKPVASGWTFTGALPLRLSRRRIH
ncbi:hypothetical protein [Ferrimicrobium acidiphilum]|uniref:Uncharacterized protein n=1 Tax=Ferrimicrobium acidiphilum TaxID=121039 RepID=A0ABV3Y151_9ACTN